MLLIPRARRICHRYLPVISRHGGARSQNNPTLPSIRSRRPAAESRVQHSRASGGMRSGGRGLPERSPRILASSATRNSVFPLLMIRPCFQILDQHVRQPVHRRQQVFLRLLIVGVPVITGDADELQHRSVVHASHHGTGSAGWPASALALTRGWSSRGDRLFSLAAPDLPIDLAIHLFEGVFHRRPFNLVELRPADLAGEPHSIRVTIANGSNCVSHEGHYGVRSSGWFAKL